MTASIAFLLIVLVAMIVLFLTEKLPIDLTAFLGLVILVFAGYVTSDQAFTGFASSAVITMMSIFIVSGALMNAGVADFAAVWIHKIVGSRELPLLITIMITAGVLSAFMNNIAATAVLMPAVASLSKKAGLQPSKIFIPLSFGAILGGTTTLVGTPPNILAGSVLEAKGLKPFELFDFTILGGVLLALGVIYMVIIGRKLLPDRKIHEDDVGRELAELYRLKESSFTLKIPKGSSVEGKTLAETGIGNALGVQVIAVTHKGDRMLAPPADTHLCSGDELLVSGSRERLTEILEIQGLDLEETIGRQIKRPQRGVSGVKLRINKGSKLLNKSLLEYDFRKRFGVAVMAIKREENRFTKNVGDISLEEGDILFGIGTSKNVANLAERNDLFDIELSGIAALDELNDEPVLVLHLPEDSPLVGKTIAKSHVSGLMGIMVIGILQKDKIEWTVSPDEILRADDRLFVSGEKDKLIKVMKMGNVELVSHPSTLDLESEKVGVVEATIAPRSSLDGRTLGETDFRKRRGLQVLAVWREGHPIREQLSSLSLRVGDGLLLQGKREALAELPKDKDLVVLSEVFATERNVKKAPFAVGGLFLMIGLVLTGFQPIQVAAFAAATFVVLTGVISMKEAYRVIEWRAIFLVAAVLPVGIAMESSGTAQLISDSVAFYAGQFGPYAVLGSLIVLSSLLSQGLDGAPAVVLLAPVVFSTAEKLNISPYPLMMGVALAASAAFMTPFSHKANLLVMGAGGYKSWDYIKVGTPLTIVILATLVFLVPVIFPF